MRSVVLTATLLTALWFGAPAPAAAQEPEPAPAPAPPPAPPSREYAVPRSEKIKVRDSEVRVRENVPENRRQARDADPAPGRESANERRSSVKTAGADDGSRRREFANASATASADDEQRQRGAERRGAVRRPPSSDGSRGSGGSQTSDRAVPRSSAPRQRDRDERVYVYPDYYRNYNRYYDPWGYGGFGLGYFYYSPWGWMPSYSGYGYDPGYGYGGPQYSAYGYDIGSVKLKVKPRDAEVYVDGYFAGQVDDFDGILQALKLDSGGHRIEIRKPGYESLQFDVRVEPDRSVTFRGELKPVP